MGQILTWGSRPHEHECHEVGEESIVTDVHIEPAQLKDRPKDQSKELIEVNLAIEEKEA